MRLEVLVRVGTGIAELQRRCNNAAVLLVVALAVEHPEGFGRHTIDAPVGVPVLVAYRYREPSVIRSDKMDQLSLPALDPQCFPLAGVRGVVPIYISRRDGTTAGYQPRKHQATE